MDIFRQLNGLNFYKNQFQFYRETLDLSIILFVHAVKKY